MKKPFDPDYSLIRDWQAAAEDSPPFAGPYVAQFRHEGSQLHYIAAHHGGDVNSPTLKTVKQQFDKFAPDIVVVEGVHADEISPAWYLEHCRTQAKENFREGGEGAYATVLAGEKSIDFMPAEPSDRQLYEGFLQQGYTLRDVLGRNIAVMIKQRQDNGTIGDDTVERQADNVTRSYLNEIGLPGEKFDFEDFRGWYKARMGKDFSLAAIAEDDGSPHSDPNANFLQKMMTASDQVREPYIVNVIAGQLAQNKKVLVVYGGAHLAKQEKVFEKMLGKPRYAQPFA